MAKYTVTHTCGCEETYNIVGTNVRGERDRKVKWLSEQPCKECELAENIKAMDERGGPLTGSEKQIEWANSIRIKAFEGIRSIKGQQFQNYEYAKMDDDAEKIAEGEAFMAKVDGLLAQTDAKFWIDRRNHIGDDWWSEACKIAKGDNTTPPAKAAPSKAVAAKGNRVMIAKDSVEIGQEIPVLIDGEIVARKVKGVGKSWWLSEEQADGLGIHGRKDPVSGLDVQYAYFD